MLALEVLGREATETWRCAGKVVPWSARESVVIKTDAGELRLRPQERRDPSAPEARPQGSEKIPILPIAADTFHTPRPRVKAVRVKHSAGAGGPAQGTAHGTAEGTGGQGNGKASHLCIARHRLLPALSAASTRSSSPSTGKHRLGTGGGARSGTHACDTGSGRGSVSVSASGEPSGEDISEEFSFDDEEGACARDPEDAAGAEVEEDEYAYEEDEYAYEEDAFEDLSGGFRSVCACVWCRFGGLIGTGEPYGQTRSWRRTFKPQTTRI